MLQKPRELTNDGWTQKGGLSLIHVLCLLPQVACTFAMLLLFRVLSTTAEDYFSPILTQMSKDFYLPPRLAGGAGMHATMGRAAYLSASHNSYGLQLSDSHKTNMPQSLVDGVSDPAIACWRSDVDGMGQWSAGHILQYGSREERRV